MTYPSLSFIYLNFFFYLKFFLRASSLYLSTAHTDKTTRTILINEKDKIELMDGKSTLQLEMLTEQIGLVLLDVRDEYIMDFIIFHVEKGKL